MASSTEEEILVIAILSLTERFYLDKKGAANLESGMIRMPLLDWSGEYA